MPVNKLEKDQLVQQFGKSVDIETIPSKSVWTVIVRKDGQWADARVQQAFSMALDRKEMIALIGFGEGQITGPVPPYFANYALTEKEIADTCGKFDPAEARKLLAATGFDTSKEYRLKFATVGNPNWEKFVEIVGTQLQKNLGVKTKAIGEDYATWLNKSLLAGDYDLNTYPSTSYEDPTSYAGFWDLTVGGRPNHTGLKSQELADLLTKQAAQYDNKARQQQVKDLQKKAWEVGNPFIPTFVGVGYSAVWNYVKGRVPASRGALSYLAGTTYIDKG